MSAAARRRAALPVLASSRRRAASLLVPLALVLVAAPLVARRGLLLVTVDGNSMAPALAHGDRVLVVRGRWGLRPGTVVVGRAPGDWNEPPPLFVKRLLDRPVPRGTRWVQGDGPSSADSRAWGPVPEDALIGRVLCQLGHGTVPYRPYDFRRKASWTAVCGGCTITFR